MTIIEGASPREAELEEQNAALEDRISDLRGENETLLDGLREAENALQAADDALDDVQTELLNAIRSISKLT